MTAPRKLSSTAERKFTSVPISPILSAPLTLPCQRRATSFLNAFLDFALQDNILEVAIGLILGAAFTKVVTSFISDILLPPLSLLPGLGRNLDEKFLVLRHGTGNATVVETPSKMRVLSGQTVWQMVSEAASTGYNTVEQAQADGAVILAWG